PRYSDYLASLSEGRTAGECQTADEGEPATESNIEGPFYRPGAPFRTRLYDDGEPGRVLVISGTVVARNGRPLAGALLDSWQASAAGRYDSDDPRTPPKPDAFRLRGKVKTDREGKYQFETVWPSPYQVGPDQTRPAHIHLKVSHNAYRALTTQI